MEVKDFIFNQIKKITLVYLILGSFLIIFPVIILIFYQDIIFIIGGIISAFIGILFIIRSRSFFNPESDYIYKSLKRYGDPRIISSDIDNEIKKITSKDMISSTIITKSWFIKMTCPQKVYH